MQDATGTASEDMMGLFDTIQKAFFIWALTTPTCCHSSLKPALF
ncbi:Phage tail length tape-measure protein [Escherichia coli ISC7]|uniref:Phage tail length tape-measure protein n=1 Tax=Escherichia coli ISC7 TaxID=1432555 RepID=W1EQB6_ECOLX|nr:Phage tail length tape-measure protein [Escherichia coli ISC7]